MGSQSVCDLGRNASLRLIWKEFRKINHQWGCLKRKLLPAYESTPSGCIQEVRGLIPLISTKGRSLKTDVFRLLFRFYRMDTKWLNLLFGHDMVRS